MSFQLYPKSARYCSNCKINNGEKVALTPIAEYRAKRKAEIEIQAKETSQKGQIKWIQATITTDQNKRIKLSPTVQTPNPFPDYIGQSNKKPKSKLVQQLELSKWFNYFLSQKILPRKKSSSIRFFHRFTSRVEFKVGHGLGVSLSVMVERLQSLLPFKRRILIAMVGTFSCKLISTMR
jgi:hypothetical protein